MWVGAGLVRIAMFAMEKDGLTPEQRQAQAVQEGIYARDPRFVGGRVIEQFASYVGHERLLFASGLLTYDVLPAMAQITYADITDSQKADIAAGNLQRLLAEVQA